LISGDRLGVSVLDELFGKCPVVVEEVRISEDVPAPHPLEDEQVATSVSKRRIEFAAGRYCARRALARLNIKDFVLRNGRDRAPCWPAGIVGSITHTGDVNRGGYCAVVVGHANQVVTVGVDAEQAKPLERPLWAHVLTTTERRTLEMADVTAGGLWAKTIFSAKECFYKAQFPLSGQFLGFHDVEVDLDLRSSTFVAGLASGAPRGLPLTRCAGRFLRHDDLVVTGIALLA
jgi:4'-phosphopantetheinyl transferase EntD